MKCIWFFLLGTATLFAQNKYTSGQAARLTIGQETFTAQDQSSSDTILGAAAGIAYAADTLFVADDNRVSATPENNRVLLFTNLSSQIPVPTGQLAYTRKCPACLGQASIVLGQPNMTTKSLGLTAGPNAMRQPLAVASDGVHLVAADTNHNRVLIWNSIPSYNNQPADVVVGQPNFTTAAVALPPTGASMRGPEGVWIQNGKLYVADTGNNRVLIFNRIPTSNGASADVVLGQPNLTTAEQPTLAQQSSAAANILLNPVAVTSDGLHLFVTDLGYNRVLIWNSIPSVNQAAADVVVGQPDMVSTAANNSFTTSPSGCILGQAGCQEVPVLCTTSTGTDSNGNPTYPPYCNSTLSFPRFALSDGRRLYISDSGEDRVLVFEQIPTQNGQAADAILGQLGGNINQASDATDSLRTPGALAWDGTNLYVADTFNRRIEVFTPTTGANYVGYSGVRNAASLMIFGVGRVTIGGTITAGDSVRIAIGNTDTNAVNCTPSTATATGTSSTNCGTAYTYQVQSGDTLNSIVTALVKEINAGNGDPNVLAYASPGSTSVLMTAKVEGSAGDNVTYTPSVSASATETATGAAGQLMGGADASQLGPGTTVAVLGQSALSAQTATADLSKSQLPTELGGTQVYINGIAAPLYFVSPFQINAQIPWEVNDTTSVSVYVRSVMNDGSVLVTTPIATTIVQQNPGIYTQAGFTQYPMPGVITHAFSQASGAVLVNGSIQAGDVAQVTIQGRSYSYTVQAADSLPTVTAALLALINQDPQVNATAYPAFANNIIIKARIPGPDGNSISLSATVTNSGTTPELTLTTGNTTLCCANVANSPVTPDNPAQPGETVLVYASGLGLPVITADTQPYIVTGQAYPAGAPATTPVNFVTTIAGSGGLAANVLYATLEPGAVGTFVIAVQLSTSLCSDPLTQLYLSQDVFVSNIVTLPVVNAASPASQACSTTSLPPPAPAYRLPGRARQAGRQPVGARQVERRQVDR